MNFALNKAPTSTPALQKCVFSADQEERPNTNAITHVNNMIKENKKISDLKIANEASKALCEDASIYEYDNIYDQFKEKCHPQRSTNQPRYIDKLISTHEKRKREQQIILERMEKKEVDRECKAMGEQQVFMTKSYMELMNMKKKYEILEGYEETYNKSHLPSNDKGLQSFYSKMLTQNKAVGGGLRENDQTKDITEQKNAVDQLQDKLFQIKEIITDDTFQKKQMRRREDEQKMKEKKRERSREKEKEEEKKKDEEKKNAKKEEDERKRQLDEVRLRYLKRIQETH